MTQQNRRKSIQNSKISPCDNSLAFNIAEKQAALRQSLKERSANNSKNAPVAYALIEILPNGQAVTTLLNIEPEHVPIILEAGIKARKTMTDFFDGVDKKSAQIIPIRERRKA